jgi:flagellar biosynthesis/type III secretory pathway chaperone
MSKAHSARARAAVESLTDEVAGYRTLLELLSSEQEALRVADADALARVTQAKLTQVYMLQDLGASRAQALRDQGFPTNGSGMRDLLSRCAEPQRAGELWDALVTLAETAQRQNTLNSRLARVQQRHVDRAMAALWNAAGCESTYGADGRSQHRALPRSLAAI